MFESKKKRRDESLYQITFISVKARQRRILSVVLWANARNSIDRTREQVSSKIRITGKRIPTVGKRQLLHILERVDRENLSPTVHNKGKRNKGKQQYPT